MCKCGDLLHSPALRYTTQDLAANLDVLRKEKTLKELPEEETETRTSDDGFKVCNYLAWSIFVVLICFNYFSPMSSLKTWRTQALK